MTGRVKTGLVVAVSLLAILAATAAFSLSDISARAAQYRGREVGEVLIGSRVVMSIRTSAGGMGPVQRAETAADRLGSVPEEEAAARQVAVRRVGSDQGVYVGRTLITTVSSAEAKAHGTSRSTLAAVWRDNIIRALGGVPVATAVGPGSRDQRRYYSDWAGTKQKWVPILSVANNGVRVGAAQVAGPPVQVDQVKAVAQLQLEFQSFARIYAYIPVSTLSVTKLDRVQGVSVWATGDLQIVRF